MKTIKDKQILVGADFCGIPVKRSSSGSSERIWMDSN